MLSYLCIEEELTWDSSFDFEPPSFEDETFPFLLYPEEEDEVEDAETKSKSSFYSAHSFLTAYDDMEPLIMPNDQEFQEQNKCYDLMTDDEDDDLLLKSEEEAEEADDEQDDSHPEDSWWYSDAKAPESKYDEWHLSFIQSMKMDQVKSHRRYGGIFNPSVASLTSSFPEQLQMQENTYELHIKSFFSNLLTLTSIILLQDKYKWPNLGKKCW